VTNITVVPHRVADTCKAQTRQAAEIMSLTALKAGEITKVSRRR
jgi:hypothetical protein